MGVIEKGVGYLHNGEDKTSINVFDKDLEYKDIMEYPYVCWYGE